MVKIINQLGDVKVGRQGEVVYQRKYGEQIRRQASPKRAISSEAQIAHRQLYRAALDWRKLLSLPNRRYLEGYCIANGIVDRYHIPLAWSRFALKLYLQAIKFVIITKPVAGEEGGEGLFEFYDDCNTSGSVRKATWGGQTFTPSLTHDILKVRLKLYRSSDPAAGYFVVSIRATDGEGHPTGEDIVSASMLMSDIGFVPHTWYDFVFPTNPTLSATVKYAIVFRAPNAPTDKYVNPSRRTTDPAYEGGCFEYSTNSGVSWTSYDQDWCFEEYGLTIGKVAIEGLLHIRHPALLTVVHKRGELTINGYDTLSSLDDEYLTGQVGVDVEAGDLIEATTLCGIDYNYEVK